MQGCEDFKRMANYSITVINIKNKLFYKPVKSCFVCSPFTSFVLKEQLWH